MKCATLALVGWLLVPATGSAQTDAQIADARLAAGAEIALTDLGYRIDWPDGVLDPQSEAALSAIRSFLALPPDTPLLPSLVDALATLAVARADGLLAAADSRRLREQAAVIGRPEESAGLAVAAGAADWDR